MNFLSFLPIIGNLIDKVIPDKDAKNKMKLELIKQAQSGNLENLKGSFGVIGNEATSEHWLVAAWRPVTMLIFLGMIVAWWFGFTPDNVTEVQLLELFALVKIGLGGYVVGRSVEKTADKIMSKF